MKVRVPNLLLALVPLATAAPALAEEDVRFEIASDQRVVNVGENFDFTITLRNDGDTAAADLQVGTTFSTNLDPISTCGTGGDAKYSSKPRKLVFPSIPSLDAGQAIVLKVRVQAKTVGFATCRLSMTDTALGGLTLEKDEAVRVK